MLLKNMNTPKRIRVSSNFSSIWTVKLKILEQFYAVLHILSIIHYFLILICKKWVLGVTLSFMQQQSITVTINALD